MKNVLSVLTCIVAICSISCNNRNVISQAPQEIKSPPTLDVCEEENKSTDQFPKGMIVYEEEVLDRFRVGYSIVANELIADTIWVSPTAFAICANRSLILTVRYDDEIIVENHEIRSTSFEGIANAYKFIMSPHEKVILNVTDDTLNVHTAMSVTDTDWMYELEIKVSKTGEISLHAINVDDLPSYD